MFINNPSNGQQSALIAALSRLQPQGGGQPRVGPRTFIDGMNPGETQTLPGELTPYGRFHEPPEQQGNPYATPGNVGDIASGRNSGQAIPDVRQQLQGLLTSGGQMFSGGQGHSPFIPHGPMGNHYHMVNMAQQLARFLAQQHTGGLRRYGGLS
jgi:hypothetical protein